MQEALDCKTNSPCKYPGNCIDNSIDNLHIDVRMLRVKRSIHVIDNATYFPWSVRF